MNNKANLFAVSALAIIMNGCASVSSGMKGTYKIFTGCGDDCTSQEIFCHGEAEQGKKADIGINTATGAGVGAAAGGVKTLIDKRSSAVADVLGFGGVGAALGATFGAVTHGNEYNKIFEECMDYTKQHPEQWKNAVPAAPERTYNR